MGWEGGIESIDLMIIDNKWIEMERKEIEKIGLRSSGMEIVRGLEL